MTDWHTRAIIYQIDTALFYDLNGDGCGDIAGITAKLRYIRRMGATVIWITPFYLTPFLDEGYDVSDHLQVDPRFGKLADIITFIEQARELGMQVIIELLIQHTSDAHPWFRAWISGVFHLVLAAYLLVLGRSPAPGAGGCPLISDRSWGSPYAPGGAPCPGPG